MRSVLKPPVFLGLFALSGFSGLIYESIWTHYLKLFLGHAAYAQSLVLAIFMGGMAAGSWLASRLSTRWSNLLRGYAVTEGLIGAFALVFHEIFVALLEVAYHRVLPGLGTPAWASLFKWALSALLILPPSVLLGMTFPLMSAGLLRVFPDRPGRTIALLYFTNSIGAAVGVLASGFLLIGWVGLPGTVRTAGTLNLLLAGLVWVLARDAGAPRPRAEPARGGDSRGGRRAGLGWLLSAAAVTGASSFMYEIGWIRMLSLVLGSSTHAFELMLSAFILGLALGGLSIHRRIDRLEPIRSLGLIQVAMGLLALLTLLAYGQTFAVMQWLVGSLERTDRGYLLFNLASNGIAVAIMLPATFCAGMTLPLITSIMLGRGAGESSIGAVYAANTVGAITGVFASIHLGLPFLGLKGLILLGAALDVGLGLALLWGHLRAAGDRAARHLLLRTSVVGIAATVATLLFVQLDAYKMASGVFRFGRLLTREKDDLLFHRDGKTATVSVVRNLIGEVSLRTNGKTDAQIAMGPSRSTMDEATMVLAAALPHSMRPGIRSAAVVGLGSGLTTEVLLAQPGMERVDTVEIEEQMVTGANHFRPLVEHVYTDPRSHIHVDDAKTFFSTHASRYDLIVSEPSNPWVSGVAGLFSEEFYRLIGTHLSKDGLFVQWVQLYEIDVPLVASVLKAISGTFSDYVAYAPNDSDLLIVATREGHVPVPGLDLPREGEARAWLTRIGVSSPQDLALRRIGTKATLGPVLASYEIHSNSDYRPVLDQGAARARFVKSDAKSIIEWPYAPLPALEMLERTPRRTDVTRVTPSPHYQASNLGVIASQLSAFLSTSALPPGSGHLPPEFLRQAIQLREAYATCAVGAAAAERLPLLFNMTLALTPYLSARELDAAWAAVIPERCAERLPDVERRFLDLAIALGHRDGRLVLAHATSLLDGASGFPAPVRRYLVAAAMLGALNVDQPEEARRVWSAYGLPLFTESELPFLYRVLTASAADR